MDGSSTVITHCQPKTLDLGFAFEVLEGQGEA